jgi:SAM-dependent methyltransferase
VLVCLALEHVDAFEAAIDGVARVLEPGGRFVLVLCHPLLQTPGSGWIDDQIVGERYWRVGPYLPDHAVVDEVAPGVDLRFIHRPLSRYVHALGRAGFLIDDMEEPAPPARFVADTWGYEEAVTIPRVLLMRARRV